MRRLLCLSLLIVLGPSLLWAEVRETKVPLHDGKLQCKDLVEKLTDLKVPPAILKNLPQVPAIQLDGVGGFIALRTLSRVLGDGVDLSVSDNDLIIRVDTDKLKTNDGNGDRLSTLQLLMAHMAPTDLAKYQKRLGLFLPAKIDDTKPLIVLIHGLDSDAGSCWPIQDLLQKAGKQTAVFAYPSEQHLADDTALLLVALTDLHKNHPKLHLDFVTISMGGLIARDYVEGDQYLGNVDHLIMIAPPTHGSPWSPMEPALVVLQSIKRWQVDKDWSPSWMFFDGLGQAGQDLTPNSKYLTQLNAHKRRAGVKYSIIAGNQPLADRMSADFIRHLAALLPQGFTSSWGIRQLKDVLFHKADELQTQTGGNDGPVTVDGAKLDGVDDFTVIPADHLALYYSIDGKKPAAYDTVLDRLNK